MLHLPVRGAVSTLRAVAQTEGASLLSILCPKTTCLLKCNCRTLQDSAFPTRRCKTNIDSERILNGPLKSPKLESKSCKRYWPILDKHDGLVNDCLPGSGADLAFASQELFSYIPKREKNFATLKDDENRSSQAGSCISSASKGGGPHHWHE